MKKDQTSCREESIIHYYPLTSACSLQLQWKDSLKICFNLRPSFPIFQWRNTRRCLPFCLQRLLENISLTSADCKKRQRETRRLLSPPPVIWLSSLGREKAACWLREAAEKIHLTFSPCGAYQTHIFPPLRGLWHVSNWCHIYFAMDRKGAERRKSREEVFRFWRQEDGQIKYNWFYAVPLW